MPLPDARAPVNDDAEEYTLREKIRLCPRCQRELPDEGLEAILLDQSHVPERHLPFQTRRIRVWLAFGKIVMFSHRFHLSVYPSRS